MRSRSVCHEFCVSRACVVRRAAPRRYGGPPRQHHASPRAVALTYVLIGSRGRNVLVPVRLSPPWARMIALLAGLLCGLRCRASIMHRRVPSHLRKWSFYFMERIVLVRFFPFDVPRCVWSHVVWLSFCSRFGGDRWPRASSLVGLFGSAFVRRCLPADDCATTHLLLSVLFFAPLLTGGSGGHFNFNLAGQRPSKFDE